MRSIHRVLLGLRFALVLGLLGWQIDAYAAEEVVVTIEIFKASKSNNSFSGASDRYRNQIKQLGFVGARAIDKVIAKGQVAGKSVELQFRDSVSKSPVRRIRVKVLSASAAETKLNIDVPEYGFSTTTTHTNGGTFLVFVPKDDLLLAVRPTRGP